MSLTARLLSVSRDLAQPEAVRLLCGEACAEIERREHCENLLKVRAFALESAAGHLGQLVDDLRQQLLKIKDYANGDGNKDPLALTILAEMAQEMLFSAADES